jgi:RNAse E (EC 3.1.4.-)
MKDGKHIREVEKVLRQALKVDRARTDIGRISKFGLLEIVRQRLGTSALSGSLETCPHCSGPVRAAIWNGGPCRP